MGANVSDKHTASFLPEVGDSCAPLEQWELVISWSLRHTHENRRFNSQRDYVRTLSRYGEEVVSEMSRCCEALRAGTSSRYGVSWNNFVSRI